ncbi:hypothetical protein B0A48_03427 [Cryoendolithus antarcticus]|uniref:Uncharacterized protein n=1 Tax=Cryoendolithus antarcticus TaxID=1507870 RepID=A0A1V8TJZ2_9PEZI|nr:hypothetical protein B0A48_03427 [Cryoendolithus antarcticus]
MPPPTQDTRFLESRQPLPLQPRQYASNGDTIAIPAVYQGLNSGPSPGVVVGIVLGSVFAFLFFVWLLWTLSNGGGWIRASRDEEESVVISHSRHRGSRSGGGEKRRSNGGGRRDRVYRSERVVRDFPPPRDVSRSRVRETVIVDDFVVPPRERRVDGDDVVEVIEEHSDIVPPRRKSGRTSGGAGYSG